MKRKIKENYNLKIILNNKPIILLSIKGDEDLVKKLKEEMMGTWGMLDTIDEALREYIKKTIKRSPQK